MRSLDGAIFMGDPAVVADWRHPIMSAQVLIAGGQIVSGLPVEIVEGGRKAVGAMLARRAAERAFCNPAAKATKLSPPSTTWACSKPE